MSFFLKHRYFTLIIGLSVMFSVMLVSWRFSFWDVKGYRFLLWNLFLAIIPLITAGALHRAAENSRWFSVTVLASIWLLFFPNAPYLITDLVHLRMRPPVPYWYDQLLLLSFAWNGLLCAFVSLLLVESSFRKISKAPGILVVVPSLLLCGFGIYLGRFLRWNSWDVIAQPQKLASEILVRFTDPFSHPRTWAVTFAFAGFMTLGYYLIKQIATLNSKI